MRHSPCVVFFDEFQALFAARSGGDDRNSNSQITSQLLLELTALSEHPPPPDQAVTVIAATNHPNMIDTALLRPGACVCEVQRAAWLYRSA